MELRCNARDCTCDAMCQMIEQSTTNQPTNVHANYYTTEIATNQTNDVTRLHTASRDIRKQFFDNAQLPIGIGQCCQLTVPECGASWTVVSRHFALSMDVCCEPKAKKKGARAKARTANWSLLRTGNGSSLK